jgi:hypothetical protein
LFQQLAVVEVVHLLATLVLAQKPLAETVVLAEAVVLTSTVQHPLAEPPPWDKEITVVLAVPLETVLVVVAVVQVALVLQMSPTVVVVLVLLLPYLVRLLPMPQEEALEYLHLQMHQIIQGTAAQAPQPHQTHLLRAPTAVLVL